MVDSTSCWWFGHFVEFTRGVILRSTLLKLTQHSMMLVKKNKGAIRWSDVFCFRCCWNLVARRWSCNDAIEPLLQVPVRVSRTADASATSVESCEVKLQHCFRSGLTVIQYNRWLLPILRVWCHPALCWHFELFPATTTWNS